MTIEFRSVYVKTSSRMEELHGFRTRIFWTTCLLSMLLFTVVECKGINCAYCAKGCNNVTNTCEACLSGFYGERCELQCAQTCDYCEKSDGTCKKCLDGWYGNDCSNACRTCPTCDMVWGNCTQCHPTYWGPTCEQDCEETCYACNITTRECITCNRGSFGKSCTKQCGNCRRGLCEREDGSCVYGCNDGWHGSKCNKNCGTNCMICDQQNGACLMCNSTLWGEMCDQSCDLNCDFCNVSTGVCLECKEGFYGDMCTERCGHCLDTRCDKVTGECAYQCKDGWYGRKCDQQCIANCTRCTSKDSCIVCRTGLSGDRCDVQCPDICVSCMEDMITKETICTECKADYKLPRRNCSCTDKKCVRFEEDWSGRTCVECEENTGWFLQHGTCCPCSNCLGGNGKCASNGTCVDGCKPKYYPKEEGCDKFCDIPHCIWCEPFFSFSKVCIGCESGYYPSPEGCKQCSSHCKGGNLNCNNQTGECLNGCEVNWFGERCESGCNDQFCSKCDNTGTCLRCKDTFWGPECFNSCPVNCTSCSDTTGECTNCIDGYYGTQCLNTCANCIQENCSKQGLCKLGCKAGWYGVHCDMPCLKGCAECEDDKTCQKCYDGVSMIGNKCETRCETCLDGKCDVSRNCKLGCIGGWYGEKCTSGCSFGCATCLNDKKCDSCRQAYALEDVTCKHTCENCVDGLCDANGKCKTGCTDGWHGNQCDHTCHEGCKSCKNADSCDICKDKYKLEGNQCARICDTCVMNDCDLCSVGCISGWYGAKCEFQCSDGCDKCENAHTCTFCRPDFRLVNNHCIGICSNCIGSVCNAEEVCTNGCVGGWFGDKCDRKCSAGCESCASESACDTCAYGYILEQSKCRKKCENCISGACDKTEVCSFGCNPGYFGMRCNLKCPNGCTTCPNSDSCSSCQNGLYGRKCENKCPETCQSCNIDSTNGKLACHHCNKGFMLPSKKCTCSDTKCTHFDKTTPTNDCLQCTDGWFPHYGTCCPCQHCNGGKAKCSNRGCTDGCHAGWYSEATGCDQRCGIEKCVRCESNTNGNLLCLRCEDGYYPVGIKCSKCSSKCGGELNPCDGVTGRCLNGCKLGWGGDYCNSSVAVIGSDAPVCLSTCLSCNKELEICRICKPGYWGSICEKQCSKQCKNTCDKVTGKCTNTCSKYCQKEETDVSPYCNLTTGLCLRGCMNGWYGLDCRHRCGINCFEGLCDQKTGTCQNGCVQGWSGAKCNDTENLVVLPGMGLIAGGVIAAVVLVVILVIMGCLIWKCKQKSKERKEASNGSAKYPVYPPAPSPYVNHGIVMDSVL